MKKTLIFILVLISASLCFAEGPDIDVYEPDKVLKIADDSSKTYLLNIKEASVFKDEPHEKVITPWLQKIQEADGGYRFDEYELTGKSKQYFEAGEKYFEAKDYKKAVRYYTAVAKANPKFKIMYTYAGDAYYMMGQYEKALKFFNYAVKVNYYNYQAHWFLADTYWEMGKKQAAAREATIAHVLNRNHRELRKRMIYYRNQSGRPWKEWSYDPKCVIKKKDDNTILIYTTDEWTGYGLAKALWLHEDGYAEKHISGGTNGAMLVFAMEAELMLCSLGKTNNRALVDIAKEGDLLMSFIMYEVLSLDEPTVMLGLNEEGIKETVQYLYKYH